MTVSENTNIPTAETKVEVGVKRENPYKTGGAEAKRRRIGLDLENDCGILYTTPNKWLLKKAGTDLLWMLKRECPLEEVEKKELTVEEQIEADKKEEAVSTNRFNFINDQKMPPGVGFIKTSGLVPSEIVPNLLVKVGSGAEKSKNLGRLLPLDNLCKPHLEAFKKMAEEKIKPAFENGLTWCLQFKARNSKTFSKDDVLKVVDQWSDGHKVCIDNPDICIYIELSPLFCGVSVLKKWNELKKYNVQSLMDPETAKLHHARSEGGKKEEKKPVVEEKAVEVVEEKSVEVVEEKVAEVVEEKVAEVVEEKAAEVVEEKAAEVVVAASEQVAEVVEEKTAEVVTEKVEEPKTE